MLYPDEWVLKVNYAINFECVRGLDRDAAIAGVNAYSFPHQQCTARGRLFHEARAFDHVGEGFGRAIHDRNFQVINFDISVINTATPQSCEQMLDGRKHDASSHQRRAVTTLPDRLNI